MIFQFSSGLQCQRCVFIGPQAIVTRLDRPLPTENTTVDSPHPPPKFTTPSTLMITTGHGVMMFTEIAMTGELACDYDWSPNGRARHAIVVLWLIGVMFSFARYYLLCYVLLIAMTVLVGYPWIGQAYQVRHG